MSDMADWLLENADIPWDGFGYDHTMASCKFCGEPELYWEKTESGWRLFSAPGKTHVCGRPLYDDGQ